MFFGQAENKQEQWTKIESPSGDMSFAVPPNFLVDNEDEAYRVIGFRDDATMRIEIEKTGSAKKNLKMQRRFYSSDNEAKISSFEVGDFIGDVFKYEKEKGFSISIYVASSKASYVVSAYSKNLENSAAEIFIRSIKLANQSLFKQASQANQPEEETKISIASLKTSPVILDALRKKNSYTPKITYDLKEGKLPEDNTRYSRPLITLRKPRANYTDGARQAGVRGTVKLKVLFLANGEVGDITVLSPLAKGLSENAVDAAGKIKFLPAEVDGKAVDVSKMVQYSFTIY